MDAIMNNKVNPIEIKKGNLLQKNMVLLSNRNTIAMSIKEYFFKIFFVKLAYNNYICVIKVAIFLVSV